MSVHERGRKPTLTADADALAKAPPAPAWLHAEAKAEWRRVMPLLIARRIITKADLAGLETYCVMVGTVRRIEKAQAEGEIDLKAFGAMNRAAQTARQLASEYGLTPTSRARMGAVAPEDVADDDDPLAVT